MQSSIPSASRAALPLVVLLLSACGESSSKPTTGPATAAPAIATVAPARVTDAGQLARGAKIYKANCAVCHGGRAQGTMNWQKPGLDGKYPPPPIDGSAHAWHHPTAVLKDVIANGTQRIGGNMPPWRDKISEADIEAVIVYFQSLWPDEIYHAWADMDRRARKGSAK